MKIILTTLILLTLYSVGIRYIPQQKMEPQNMWQENMIKMQDFIYEKNYPKNVILGSSLSMCISPLNNQYYNLAAGGGNPFTGLEILKRSDKNVNRIFIETNYLLTKTLEDDKYLGSLFMPLLYNLRKRFVILREKEQPASLAGHYLRSKLIDKIYAERGTEIDNSTLQKRVAIFKKSYRDSITVKNIVKKNLDILLEYLKYFKHEGTELVFYEMPIDCALTNDPLPIYCRNQMNSFCQQNNLKQLPLEPCSKYQTSDGNHLMGESAERYKAFFYEEAAKFSGAATNK